MRYRTAGGKVVTWTCAEGYTDYGHWKCDGCRAWDWGKPWDANDHAGSCRAM
jgi:hypothetical protein